VEVGDWQERGPSILTGAASAILKNYCLKLLGRWNKFLKWEITDLDSEETAGLSQKKPINISKYHRVF